MPEQRQAVFAYIAAGSSIEASKHLDAAMTELRTAVDVTAVSTVYRTPAINRPGDPDFLNCVFQVRTTLSPRTLKFSVLHEIERRLGRIRSADRYAPRSIDLDLILLGDETCDEPDLTIPHPDLSRWFVWIPLLELSPTLSVPGLGELRKLGFVYPGQGRRHPVPHVTRLLQRRLNQ